MSFYALNMSFLKNEQSWRKLSSDLAYLDFQESFFFPRILIWKFLLQLSFLVLQSAVYLATLPNYEKQAWFPCMIKIMSDA